MDAIFALMYSSSEESDSNFPIIKEESFEIEEKEEKEQELNNNIPNSKNETEGEIISQLQPGAPKKPQNGINKSNSNIETKMQYEFQTEISKLGEDDNENDMPNLHINDIKRDPITRKFSDIFNEPRSQIFKSKYKWKIIDKVINERNYVISNLEGNSKYVVRIKCRRYYNQFYDVFNTIYDTKDFWSHYSKLVIGML